MIKKIKHLQVAFIRDESGQDLIEYALVAGLIALGAIVAMTSLSTKLGAGFTAIGNAIAAAT